MKKDIKNALDEKMQVKLPENLNKENILSELDIGNRERLLKTLPNRAQVIITGTDLLGISIKETYKLIKLKEEEDGRNKN